MMTRKKETIIDVDDRRTQSCKLELMSSLERERGTKSGSIEFGKYALTWIAKPAANECAWYLLEMCNA